MGRAPQGGLSVRLQPGLTTRGCSPPRFGSAEKLSQFNTERHSNTLQHIHGRVPKLARSSPRLSVTSRMSTFSIEPNFSF